MKTKITAKCACGASLNHGFGELGCIECGRACCGACGVSLESVTYCAVCASALLEIPSRIPLGALSVQS